MILLLSIVLVGCNNEKASTLTYDEIKKIMADSLQTEDGKRAIREILNDQTFRDLLVLEHAEVENAMKTTLLSTEAEEFWKRTFEDPTFKETLAKSMKAQQEDLMKKLMTDAEYQETLTKFFDQPDMQKQLESILKGATIRKKMEDVVMETIENPLLQTKWAELIRSTGETGDSSKKDDSGGSGSDKKSGSESGDEGGSGGGG